MQFQPLIPCVTLSAFRVKAVFRFFIIFRTLYLSPRDILGVCFTQIDIDCTDGDTLFPHIAVVAIQCRKAVEADGPKPGRLVGPQPLQ